MTRTESTTRGPAWIATLVAVPLAVLAGLVTFWSLDGADVPAPESSAGVDSGPPVTVAAPSLSPRAEVVCRALLAHLPDTLREQVRREITAGPEQNAAYGDPAVVISCGVAPPQLPSDSTETVWGTDGVCWLSTQDGEDTVLTTVDREVAVAVVVPSGQSGPLQWASALAGVIDTAVPVAADQPTGC